MHLVS